MEYDANKGIYIPTRQDIEALGSPVFPEVIPASEAESVLRRAEERRRLNAARDISQFPLGATRNTELAQQHATELTLKAIIGVVRPDIEGLVVDEVEAFLEDMTK